jgi:hypothetical protein
MTKYGKQLTCEEFQRLMAELVSSGADIEDFYDYSHAKKCAICYQLLQELEAIAEAARDMWRYGSDNWPEST